MALLVSIFLNSNLKGSLLGTSGFCSFPLCGVDGVSKGLSLSSNALAEFEKEFVSSCEDSKASIEPKGSPPNGSPVPNGLSLPNPSLDIVLEVPSFMPNPLTPISMLKPGTVETDKETGVPCASTTGET